MERRGLCGKLLKQISDEMRKNANNAMRAQNMTLTQMDALLDLYEAPDLQLSLKELEQRLHVAQSTAAGIVSRLEQKGLVLGLNDPTDKRVKLVQITPEGLQCVRTSRKFVEEGEDRLLSGLTETECDIFYTLLLKVRSTLP